jgi:peroxisomal 3,2-trans-enoyl-CoA isomerase
MGPLKASELLLFGQKIAAIEAEKLGLVTKVFPSAELGSLIWPKLKEISDLPATVSHFGCLFGLTNVTLSLL